MSNGEDVLDNWEEIDEAGLTNTLQKIKAERSKSPPKYTTAVKSIQSTDPQITNSSALNDTNSTAQPMKLLQRNAIENTAKANPTGSNTDNAADTVKSPLEDMSATFQPVLMVLHKPNDEYQSANYTQPMQTVKILRRPTQSSDRRNNDLRPKQPIKTLQQREQEYAEARLRILGSAKNPEDDELNAATEANMIVTTTYNNANAVVTATTTTASQTAAATATSTATPTIARTDSLSKIQQQQQQQQQTPTNMSVLAGGGGVTGVTSGAAGNIVIPPIQPPPGNLKYQNHYYMQQQLQNQQANFYFQQQLPQQHYQQPITTPPIAPPQMRPAYSIPIAAAAMSPANTRNNHPQNIKYQQYKQQQHQQTWPTPSSAINTTTPIRQQQESILRLPRGPDGSLGFQMRR